MAKYFYDFSNKPIGTFSNGDGMTNITAGAGKTRSIVASSVGSGRAYRISSTANGQDLTAFDSLNNHGDDMEMLTLFSVNATVQVPGSFGALYWDYTTTNQGLSLGFLPASNVKSVILYDDKAALTVNFANFDWQNNTRYWLRWRVEGGVNHLVKIWADGTAEPAGWLFTSTYSNRTTGTHYFGIGTYTANHTIDYSMVSVGTGGDTAPMTVGEYVSGLQPSTPVGVFSGGYGAIGYGMMTRPAFTVNALDQSGNARIERIGSITQTGNARVQRVLNITQTGNARIQKALTKTQLGNARIQRTFSLNQAGNARITRIEQLQQLGNATIESFYVSNTLDQIGNARISRTESVSQTGNAFIERQNIINQTGSAFIELQNSITQVGNARIEHIRTVQQTGNARVQRTNTLEQQGDATIVLQRSIDQTGDAFVEYQHKIDQNGNTFVTKQLKIDQTGDARIVRVEQLEQIGNAKISNPTPDKLPQTWEQTGDKVASDWQDDDKVANTWSTEQDKTAASWSDEPKTEQEWKDNDSRKPSDWQRQYYD